MCENCCSVLKIFPDYSSSGVWCNFCGVGIANPKDKFPNIPEEIFEDIQFWNDVWEGFYSKYVIASAQEDSINEIILEHGKTLQKRLSKYVPCILVEEFCGIE